MTSHDCHHLSIHMQDTQDHLYRNYSSSSVEDDCARTEPVLWWGGPKLSRAPPKKGLAGPVPGWRGKKGFLNPSVVGQAGPARPAGPGHPQHVSVPQCPGLWESWT